MLFTNAYSTFQNIVCSILRHLQQLASIPVPAYQPANPQPLEISADASSSNDAAPIESDERLNVPVQCKLNCTVYSLYFMLFTNAYSTFQNIVCSILRHLQQLAIISVPAYQPANPQALEISADASSSNDGTVERPVRQRQAPQRFRRSFITSVVPAKCMYTITLYGFTPFYNNNSLSGSHI